MLKKLKGYFSFKGRIGRKGYIISFISLVIMNVIMNNNKDSIILYCLWIFFLYFSLAQGSKRCHDLGRSAWWQFVPLFPLWLFFSRGQKGSNRYGEDPMELTTPAANASE
ncbi:DUF805 domain-containing protein [Candidatus Azobacteroides pseudotrichonymphae]|nr:DUF805 domain-containing protein [Candidatus Azobacteroides pseudotrichonymphae]